MFFACFFFRFGLRIGQNRIVLWVLFIRIWKYSKKIYRTKCRICGLFKFFYFFWKLFLKNRLTFMKFEIIITGLSSWPSANLRKVNPWISRLNRNIGNKSSSTKWFLMYSKICSRRDMHTVEFGISKLWLSQMCIS